jgi:polysaccharide biosynthesis protein VpsJ
MAVRKYRGYDPFDAALSPLARRLAGSRWATVAWIQLHRRLPFQLRPLVGVEPHVNPKTLALALQGHLRLGGGGGGSGTGGDVEPGEGTHLAEALALTRSLVAARRDGGWGYPFPWANRHFHVPAGTPASVPTAFSVHALLDVAGTGLPMEPELEGAAEGAARFLAERLNRVPAEGGFLFSYTPLDERGVHNASLLSASVLARAGRRWEDEGLLELAAEAARATVRAQRADGSWPYGLTRRDGWVDSYHTGYILTALRGLRRDLAEADSRDLELDGCLDRGFAYWRQAFLQGPAVTVSPGRAYPVESHALAQGILTLLEFAREWDEGVAEASRLGWWALAHLRRGDGSFMWWKGRMRVNRIPYMRWVQAWVFRALSELAAWEAP